MSVSISLTDSFDSVRGVRPRRNNLVEAASGRRVLCPGREQRGDEDLEGVLGLRLGDLLDGRKLHAIDGKRQRAHHRLDRRRLRPTVRTRIPSRGLDASSRRHGGGCQWPIETQ
jgi:hypothetical protein